jgi:hypothetical protein
MAEIKVAEMAQFVDHATGLLIPGEAVQRESLRPEAETKKRNR